MLGGQLYFVDVAFEKQLRTIEIDGRLHETNEDLFQSDRWRQNALIMAGWRVLRFSCGPEYRGVQPGRSSLFAPTRCRTP